jgi:ATP-dependent exoDNAse (exonuclease V) beta subunit
VAEIIRFPTAVPQPFVPAAPPDADARCAALDIHRSFIVEAPAGSGKTGLLIQRLLKLLADPSVDQPEQVLAITFTTKATTEMRDRVLSHLTAAAQAETLGAPSIAASQRGVGDDDLPTTDFRTITESLARAVLARDRQVGWQLLDHPHRLNIRTIDSVSAEIARTLPILSGSGGRLTPLEDASSLHHEAARRTILLLGAGDATFDDALRDLLLHRDGNLAEIESLLANMLSLRDQWGDLIPLANHQLDETWLDDNVLPRLELALDHAIRAVLIPLSETFPSDLLAELTHVAADLAEVVPYDPNSPSPIAPCADLHSPPQPLTAHLDHWLALIHLLTTSSGELRKERGINSHNLKFNYNRKSGLHTRLVTLIEALASRADLVQLFHNVRALPPAKYPADQWVVAKSLFRVLSHALVELQFVFAASNQCDFTELSLLARHALASDSGPEDLTASLGARLQHLLVDEMQDTSTVQYHLIELLTQSWDAHSQSVFLVGDPRQSIYLFRQARVERFVNVMQTQRLGDLPLHRLKLTANFRSQSRLVENLNYHFNLIFPADSLLPYTSAAPTLAASSHACATVWHANPISSAPDAALTLTQLRQQQARRDAQEIRCIVQEWLRKPLPEGHTKPWKIAVLSRNRSHLSEIVAVLKQEDAIPFRAIEIESLAQQQEVLDLTALTRVLLHPADRTAALALLRSPCCGLSLADLHVLCGADDPALKSQSIHRLVTERSHMLPDESQHRLQRLWKTLMEAAAQHSCIPLAQLVERTWKSLSGDVFLKESEIYNANKFFELLDKLDLRREENSTTNLIGSSTLEAHLQMLFAEPATIPPGQPFVELLTMHKAKGLEWDVVLVPALERHSANDRSRLLIWSELDPIDDPVEMEADSASDVDRAAHIMLAPIAGRGEPSRALNQWLNGIHNEREAAERKRLFYVACTRAREELHLFAAPVVSAAGKISPPHGSLLEAAWPAAQAHFAAYESAVATSAQPLAMREAEATGSNSAEEIALDLAASAAVVLQRLPLAYDPTARFAAARARRLVYGEPELAPSLSLGRISRPEGSFAARSFGNVVHAALELLATRIADGCTVDALVAELSDWMPRLVALLRADGLPQATVLRLAREAHTALLATLRDPDGLWLLASHVAAASELALTAWCNSGSSCSVSAQLTSIRIDRVFRAGATPQTTGEDVLWIVDYKTSAPHSSTSLDEFLAAERATYAPQLETYARVLAQSKPNPSYSSQAHSAPREVRLALFYPTLPRLHWWPLG